MVKYADINGEINLYYIFNWNNVEFMVNLDAMIERQTVWN